MNVLNLMVRTILACSVFSVFLSAADASFQVWENHTGVTGIRFSMDEYHVDEFEGQLRIKAANAGSTTEIGFPELPLFTTMFQMEPGIAYDADFEVIESTVLSNVDIFPYQDLDWSPETDAAVIRNQDFYRSGGVYPNRQLIISEPQVMRGLELLTISVVPFRYSADTRELEVFHEIDIHVYETGTRELLTAGVPRSHTFEPLYQSLIVNYDPSDREEDYQTPSVLYICGGGSNGAITHPYYNDLVEWRHKRGYVVYETHTGITGTTTNSIKDYIENAYDNYDPPPEFVALVGDVSGSFSIPTWSYSGGDSDHPYATLDGGDLLPEVLVGRISVESSTDISVVLSKTMNYERAVYMEDNWYEKAALVGDPTSSSGISTVITNQYIENIMVNWGMEDVRTQFSGSFASWMQNQLNEGILYFNYRGYLGTSGFSSSHIENANNGHKTPFVSFITCGTGDYGWGTEIIESFIRAGTVNSPKGGVAAIGTATAGTHTAPNNIIDMGVYDGIFAKQLGSAGAALFNGKLSLYNTYPSDPNSLTTKFSHLNNLMGDPSLHLWTDTPRILDVTYETEIGFGANFLLVQVNDESGIPVENARVTAVTEEDEIFISIFTDADGTAVVPLNTEYSGDVALTVTGHNLQPVEGEFTIVTEGPIISLGSSPIQIVDSGGNADGHLNPGETAALNIPLTNPGTETALNVSVYLETESEAVEVLTDTQVIGDIESGADLTVSFDISLADFATHLEELGLFLTLFDNSGTEWHALVNVEVQGGLILVDGYSLVTGYLSHGNAAELAVELNNLGSIPVQGVTGTVQTDNNLIEIENGDLFWGDIPAGAGAMSANSFMLTASGDIINGTVFNLELILSGSDGYSRTEFVPVQIGTATVMEPLGPDSYGYYIYDSEDLGYNLALPYDWIEIDPAYGGDGTSLNMSDSGYGHPYSQNTAHIDLPFTFTFYGEDYNEISISTNGWIGFGPTDMISFRNYPVPGAGGPSPMLAVFWDDLTTDNGGQVYYLIEDDYVIIEWSDMRTYDESSSETFQAILFDAITPTGDDEILLQYKDFNNTSNGNYDGYTPYHGCYSTIGIENHMGDDGLQYSFDDEYPPTAMPLEDETALFITTQQPLALMLGDINQDGNVSVLDIILAVNHTLNLDGGTLGPLERYLADMNQDGIVNILDVILMINTIIAI